MTDLQAEVVARPARVRPGTRGEVLGGGRSAVYIDAGEFVIAVTAPGLPLMPNGVSVDPAGRVPEVTPGEEVSFGAAEIRWPGVRVRLEGAREWNPVVSSNAGRMPTDVGRRGRGILRNCRIAPTANPERLAEALGAAGLTAVETDGGRRGAAQLLRALADHDPVAAADASALLVGRGGGLTPEGDDLLGGAVAAIVAFGGAARLDESTQGKLIGALVAGDLRDRTTALSATLLALSARGLVVEPLLPILDLGVPPDRWRPALHTLLAIGHTTGRAWALGSAAAAAMLGASLERKESSA